MDEQLNQERAHTKLMQKQLNQSVRDLGAERLTRAALALDVTALRLQASRRCMRASGGGVVCSRAGATPLADPQLYAPLVVRTPLDRSRRSGAIQPPGSAAPPHALRVPALNTACAVLATRRLTAGINARDDDDNGAAPTPSSLPPPLHTDMAPTTTATQGDSMLAATQGHVSRALQSSSLFGNLSAFEVAQLARCFVARWVARGSTVVADPALVSSNAHDPALCAVAGPGVTLATFKGCSDRPPPSDGGAGGGAGAGAGASGANARADEGNDEACNGRQHGDAPPKASLWQPLSQLHNSGSVVVGE